MGQNDGLLLDSDDSDIPDLDLPPATNIRKEKTKLFSRSRQCAETVIAQRRCCSVQCAQLSLLFTLILAIAFLGFFTTYILTELEKLRSDPKYELMTRELGIIKREVSRIKTDIDILRLMTSSPGTPTWNTSALLNVRLEHIEMQISSIVDKIQKSLTNRSENDAFNSLSERVDTAVDACSRGCAAVSKLVLSSNGTKNGLFAPFDEKPKKKRSKASRWPFARDTPVIFTRAKKI